jgi:hypothetical protein
MDAQELHRTIKLEAVRQGKKMLREILTVRFGGQLGTRKRWSNGIHQMSKCRNFDK